MNTFDFTEINNLINECNIYIERGQLRVVNINGCQLMVFENGDIYRYTKTGIKLIDNIENNGHGYNQIRCGKKRLVRQRIICHVFLNLDIEDLEKKVDHIDGNRINNSITNLRIVNNQQNQWNKKAVKGYCKGYKHKYQAQISVNFKQIHLGCFNTKEEAHVAYKKAKLIYHIIN